MRWEAVELPKFGKNRAKQFPAFQLDLDEQVRKILENPLIGDPKKGALRGVRVFKYTYRGQLYLLAYEPDSKLRRVYLYQFGTHEKFYEKLSSYLK